MENIVVITGDIIGSRKVENESYDNLLYTLETTLQLVASKFGKVKYDIYRGDSFQVIIPEIQSAIKIALLIRLALKSEDKSFDARLSIGIGEYDLNRSYVKRSTGEAYILSGTGIDKLKNQNFVIYTNNPKFQARISLLTKFVDSTLTELTQKQSEVMYKYFTSASTEKAHDLIAESMGTTRENITQILNKGKYRLLEEYIDTINNSLKEFY